jgi:hypothetical protein
MKHNVVPQIDALERHRLGRCHLNQMETHGSVVTNAALGFVMLSPVIGLMTALLGAWLVD